MAHGPNVYVTLDVFVTAYRDEYAPPSLKWNGMEIQSPVLRCQVDFKS